jgi:enediyne polyketide synthase
MGAIAIVGMACRYADVRSPGQLWENVLAQRRSFRRIPRVRLNLDDYSAGRNDDRITAAMAAVLEDYEFDRARFHVSRDAFLASDMSHWLALDVASQALTDAGLVEASGKQRERTAVYVGNSLTGEFSRAGLMRLRWPYVRRIISAALQEAGSCRPKDIDELVARMEALYKAPFPASGEESLAGGLSNTIAGRICNYFDLKGGGYTVDGACASSLLAVSTACSALESRDIDFAIAGGVDLSLDPFELAGFSSLGALARDKMRVFDARSSGFWPGEGCGMLVLMRHEDAVAHHYTPYAVLRGWGISSDGHGGITRPEPAGQMLALERAYERSGYGIDSVAYFEGHGTGTAIGDATELQALSQARREAAAGQRRAAIGSIKANIGHTKAAAGVAGLIKAAMAVHHGILPPTTGCDDPHAELTTGEPVLRVLGEAEIWPLETPVRAGVSGFGFGGINVHVTLEGARRPQRSHFASGEEEPCSSFQDCELFVFAAVNFQELAVQLRQVLSLACECSYAELVDLSILLGKEADAAGPAGTVRAACLASSPEELNAGIVKLLAACEAGPGRHIDIEHGIFLSQSTVAPRIGFLFPGQASPVYTTGGIWTRRFRTLRGLYDRAHLPELASEDTQTAQPCIVTAALAGLQMLNAFGVQGSVAVGHSLGEITALHWAGACAEDELMRMVRARGRAMAEAGERGGAMASLHASRAEVFASINGDRVVVAAHNAPRQTVVSGEAAAVRRFAERLASAGITATMLPVSHAFHSPLVAGVATAFARELSQYSFAALDQRVISTVTGAALDHAADVRTLLTEQVTRPVLFADALRLASQQADLFIEVGPGTVLSGIAAECTETPVIPLDSGSESLRGLLSAIGAAFALGAPLRMAPLYQKRFGRPIDLTKKRSFLANPCEAAPESIPLSRPAPVPVVTEAPTPVKTAGSPVDVLLQLVAGRTQLPLEAIHAEARFLRDLHLNSITISQIVLEAAAQLRLPAPVATAEYTNATIAEAAAALAGLRSRAPRQEDRFPAGVDSWTRVLTVQMMEKPLRQVRAESGGDWEVLAAGNSALQDRLREEFSRVPGNGLVCLAPRERDESAGLWLLQSAQTALKRGLQQVVFLQDGGGVSALARTLYLEHPNLKVAVVDAPREEPEAAKWAAAEARANRGFAEAFYDANATRREPRLQLFWPETTEEAALSAEDVLLVTGGGKGIAAECASHLARVSGCRLALLGRSDPEADPELERNLRRLREAGVRSAYFPADIADRSAAAGGIHHIVSEFGPITAMMHGAGSNVPKRLAELTAADLQETLAPKIIGLQNLLEHVNARRLRLLMTFGSIIARTGLHGEGHYGLANEWLRLAVERWQAAHPDCRCLHLEWSVWAGIGMGQRLGVLDSLIRQGITPLPVDEAIEYLEQMLASRNAPTSTIITGRFGNLPTLRFDRQELPLMRFLEHPRVHLPGIELVADAEISSASDPYIIEHAFQGEHLLPAVMGMESMAQAAMALERSEALPTFHDLHFAHPIVVPRDKPVTVRIAALRRMPGTVAVAVRCSTTSFQLDHFNGTCVFGHGIPAEEETGAHGRLHADLALDPARDLYGRILFHRGRFCRIAGYEALHADRSTARLTVPEDTPWFARHLPPELRMGDAASRDAALHSIQACIPHKTVLPVGVERITPSQDWTRAAAVVRARERIRDGDNFVYDLRIEDALGKLCELWQGLRLRAVAPVDSISPWPLALLAPYLERKLAEIVPHSPVRIAFANGREERREPALANLLREMFGAPAVLTHRPDGKPEITGVNNPRPYLSVSHCAEVTLVAAAARAVGCDVEEISGRDSRNWELLLGEQGLALARLLAGAASIPMESASAQAWTLRESLRKAGAGLSQSLSLDSATPDGWTHFAAERWTAATFHARVRESASTVALGFVVAKT